MITSVKTLSPRRATFQVMESWFFDTVLGLCNKTLTYYLGKVLGKVTSVTLGWNKSQIKLKKTQYLCS
jgi:hypothetical protein